MVFNPPVSSAELERMDSHYCHVFCNEFMAISEKKEEYVDGTSKYDGRLRIPPAGTVGVQRCRHGHQLVSWALGCQFRRWALTAFTPTLLEGKGHVPVKTVNRF